MWYNVRQSQACLCRSDDPFCKDAIVLLSTLFKVVYHIFTIFIDLITNFYQDMLLCLTNVWVQILPDDISLCVIYSFVWPVKDGPFYLTSSRAVDKMTKVNFFWDLVTIISQFVSTEAQTRKRRKMFEFILLVNRQGKVRLTKW